MGVFRNFPYSNFHEMNMDEIIRIVKELATEWTQYQTDWGNLYENTQDALNNFIAYAENYFNTLDITVPLTELINDHAFDDVIETTLSPVVSSWLNANITEPTGVVIDNTLSISGACADAKVTGDNLKNIRLSLTEYNRFPLYMNPNNGASSGISFTWSDYKCTISGVSTSGATNNILSSTSLLPTYFKIGHTYKLKLNRTDNNIGAQVYLYNNGSIAKTFELSYKDELIFPILNNTSGILIRLYIKANNTINGTVTPEIIEWSPSIRETTFDYNLFIFNGNQESSGSAGVYFTWNGAEWRITGTPTAGAFKNVISSSNSIPSYLKLGESYQFIYDSTNSNIRIEIFTFINGVMNSGESFNDDYVYTLPTNATGIILRIFVPNGLSDLDEIIKLQMYRCFPYARQNNDVQIANFGDSLTWGRDGSSATVTQTPYTITSYLNKKGAVAVNLGVGGQGYFSTGGGQTALQKLQNTDLTPYDIITLGWGTNDNTAVLGTPSDTGNATMLGAMFNCWNYIRSQNPNCTVIFIAPPNASMFGTEANGYWYGYKRGPLGDYNLTELVEGMRKLCEKYKIPFIDNYSNGIDLKNIASLMPDGVHFNDNGYKIYSRYIANKIINSAY